MALVPNDLNPRSILTPSILSNTSSNISESSLRKTKFDDRSTTKTSLALRSFKNTTIQRQNIPDDESPFIDIFKWNKLEKISNLIGSSEFTNIHGSIEFIRSNSVYIAIVMKMGTIVIFDYRQEIDYILGQSDDGDFTNLAAGFEDGSMRIWNLKQSQQGAHSKKPLLPYYTIYPITLKGHVINTRITYISFIGESNHQLLTTDDSGLVFFHNGIRKFMNLIYVTTKILDDKFKLLNCELLPLGSAHQITDQMGVFAIMTNDLLAVVSTISLNDSSMTFVKQHFKIGKSKLVTGGETNCMSWFPSMNTSSGEVTNARLAYVWNNVMTILELDNRSFSRKVIQMIHDAKDKNKIISKLPINKTARWVSKPQKNIEDVKWIQADILCVFTTAKEMITFYYNNGMLTPVATDTLAQDLHNINVSKHRILFNNLNDVFIGQSLGWADILLHKLSLGHYAETLALADNYYTSNSPGKLAIIGLPKDRKQRGELIQPYLIKIMRESLPHLFESDKESYISLCLNIIAYITASNDLLEELYDIVQDDSVYFQSLEPFILSGSIITLPPIVLKSLVKYYVKEQNGDLLTELICTLDIKMLDIDLTIQLCKEYNLRECLVYIWNFVLNDYETPLIDFLTDIVESDEKDDTTKVYTYLSYILTGRQYPTDRFIEDEKTAKTSICNILFSSSSIKSIPSLNNDTIFPYLFTLLKFNSFEMLSTLNEFFEDSFLNEDTKLNRQYLLEALLDIYESNEDKSEFTDLDKCQFSIFIARNYPKYSQFLRLSESTLFDVITRLCDNRINEISSDCELALLSILPYYEPNEDHTDDYLIERLEMAKYYNVLIGIYKSGGKYSQALEAWMKEKNEDDDDDDGSVLMSILEGSFTSSKNPSDRLSLINVIKEHFGKFMWYPSFIKFIDDNIPQLHEKVFDVSDDDLLVYRYFQTLFDISQNDLSPFLIRYLELLILYDHDKVVEFVKQWVDKLDFDNAIGILNHDNTIEPQTILLVHHKKFLESIELIITRIEKSIANDLQHSIPDFGNYKQEFKQLLVLAISICENPSTSTIMQESIPINQIMWLNLINSLVDMANRTTGKAHDFVNECIHDCFKTISTSKSGNVDDGLFLTIFNKFLDQFDAEEEDNNNKKKATLSNIKSVLQEVFVSYSYESEMLKITMKMFNNEVYKNMSSLRCKILESWMIEDIKKGGYFTKKCSSCDKVMFGKGVVNLDQHYKALEFRKRESLWTDEKSHSKKNAIQDFRYLQLVFFNCGHGYHRTCMDGLGVEDYCVICNP
ncbi:VPS8 Vacuolar protein sorting-associated protein 8 [Candida maltosa Xu316]